VYGYYTLIDGDSLASNYKFSLLPAGKFSAIALGLRHNF
jgi:hypothetical protein